MLAWLSANLPTILVLFVVCVVVGWIAYGLIRDAKNGTSSCAGCTGCNRCHGCGAGCAANPKK